MGVQGLWQLLEGAGQPVALESLEGKVLAVDVSIWLHQTMKGMRDKNGNPLPNAHLQGLFSRVCKLLFYRIKPVFVFDGGVPLLKKQTLAARRERKEAAHRESGKTSQKLLQNMIRRQALQVALGQSVDSSLPLPTTTTTRGPDLFELAPLPEGSRILDEDSDPDEMRGSNPYTPYLEDTDQYLEDVDTESTDFRSLPYEVQHEFLAELKEVRKRDILRRAQELPENADDFSTFQIGKLLKQSRLTNQIEDVRKEMNARTSGAIIKTLGSKEDCFDHSVESGRVISEDSAHFILIKGLSKARQLDRGRELVAENQDGRSAAAAEVAAITARSTSGAAGKSPEELKQEPVPSTSRAAGDVKQSVEEAVPSTSGVKEKRSTRLRGRKGRAGMDLSRSSGSRAVPGRQTLTLSSSEEEEEGTSADGTEVVVITQSQPQKGKKRAIVIDSDSDEADAKSARLTDVVQDSTVGSSRSHFGETSTAAAAGEAGQAVGSSSAARVAVATSESLVTSSTSGASKPAKAMGDVRTTSKEADQKERDMKSQNVSREKDETSDSDDDGGFLEVAFNPRQIREEELFPVEMFAPAAPSPPRQDVARQQPQTAAASSVAPSVVSETRAAPDAAEAMKIDEDDSDAEVAEAVAQGRATGKEVGVEAGDAPDVEVLDAAGNEMPVLQTRESLTSDEEEKEAEAPEPDSEEERFASKCQGASTTGLLQLREELVEEEHTLRSEQGRQQRLATSITDQVNLEAQELLQMFGVPYLVSTTEAESQCAFLDQAQLTHGTITDDSDIWLFGGQRVYKNFFNVNKHVELFTIDKVQNMYGLDREHLINLALLCGSDYTEGIPGVGPVRALEIMAEFPGERQEGLVAFRKWWKTAQKQLHALPENKIREKLRDLEVKPGFPSMAVVEAYLQPAVDDSLEPFSWGTPDMDLLRDFAKAKFGWDTEKADEVLIPVMQELNKKQHQPRISSYFQPEQHVVKKKTFSSKRMQQALTRVTEGPAASPPLPESNVERIRKAKQILRATNPRGRGRGRGRGGGGGGSKLKVKKEVNLSESSSSSSSSGSGSGSDSSGSSGGGSGSEESGSSESGSDSDGEASPPAKKGKAQKNSTAAASKANPEKGAKAPAAGKKRGKRRGDAGDEIMKRNAERIAEARRVMERRWRLMQMNQAEAASSSDVNDKEKAGPRQGKGGNSATAARPGDHGICLEDYEDLGSSFSEGD